MTADSDDSEEMALAAAWERWREASVRGMPPATAEQDEKDKTDWASLVNVGTDGQPVKASELARERDFQQRLIEGAFTARGRLGSSDAPLTAIEAVAWGGAHVVFKQGEMSTKAHRYYCDIRVRLARHEAPPPRLVASAEGTPIEIAYLVHARPDLVDKYHARNAEWHAAGKPRKRVVPSFSLNRPKSHWRRSGWREDALVEIDTEEWTKLKEAEAELAPSLWRRVLAGECVLVGYREDLNVRMAVPRAVVDTIKREIVQGHTVIRTASGNTYLQVTVYEAADYQRVASTPSSSSAKPEPAAGKTADRQRRIVVAAETIKGRQPAAWGAATKKVKADLVRAELQVSLKARGFSDDTIIRTLEKAKLA